MQQEDFGLTDGGSMLVNSWVFSALQRHTIQNTLVMNTYNHNLFQLGAMNGNNKWAGICSQIMFL